MDNAIGTDDERIVFGTACLCLCLGFPVPTDCYLRVEKQSTTMYRPGSFRVSETDVPCTKDFFFAQVLCQFLKYMSDRTSNKCGK